MTLTHAHGPAGFSGPSLPKAPLPCREGWKHGALESAGINVKLCSITLKQPSSKYFCPHLKAERAITLSLMVFTPGQIRLLGLGPRGCRGRQGLKLPGSKTQQSDRTEHRGVSGEGSAWWGAQHGLCTLPKHCPCAVLRLFGLPCF